VRAPPQPRVWADQTDPLVITVATYEEAPPRLDLRDLSEALQQEGGNVGAPTPRFVARFVVPSVREGTMLHFDFADAVRFVPWSFLLLHFSSHWAHLGSLWLARVPTRGGTKGLGEQHWERREGKGWSALTTGDISELGGKFTPRSPRSSSVYLGGWGRG